MIPLPDSTDRALLQRAAEFTGWADFRELTPEVLRKISADHSLEFATALIFDRLFRDSETSRLWEELHRQTIKPDRDALFALVPGAFYQQHTKTGADGKRVIRIIRDLGCRCELIPIESFGRLKQNGSIISAWLRENRNERIVLVSLSKGTADVKFALVDDPRSFGNVISWASLSGIGQGTPLINWLKRQPLRLLGVKFLLWLRGQTFASAEDLVYSQDTSWSPLPPHLGAIHVCAFPLPRHLRHPWAPRAYRRLRNLGPNDGGGVLLGDVGRWPGTVFPVWGADHYLQPGWDCTALLRNILAKASQGLFHATACAR